MSWGAALLAAPAGLRAEEIRIWPTAVVGGENILLRDVAELTGFDGAAVERLQGLIVSAAPREGGEILVQTGDVRGALTESGANLASIRILGASRCKVSRTRQPVEPTPVKLIAQKAPQTRRSKPVPVVTAAAPTGETLRTALEVYLRAQFSQADDTIEIRFSPACRRDLDLESAVHTFHIRGRDHGKLGLVTLEVEIASKEGQRRTTPIVAEVSLVKSVVVAKRIINRGEAIEGRHLRYETRRFTDASAIGLTDLAAAVGQQSNRFIQAGEMLSAQSVESRPLVRRGDPVTVWVRQGALVIKTSGRAQQSGALGERIEVMRDGSRRRQDVFEATVTGPATVTRGLEAKVAMR